MSEAEDAFIEHDGQDKPVSPVTWIELRNPSALGVGWQPRWDWAGKPHMPQDVMRYKFARRVSDLADHMAAPGALRGMVKVAAPLTRAAVLGAAAQACLKSRAATHGALEDSFAAIAAIWSVRLGVTVSPAQVAIMMVDLKTVRAWGNAGHADNWIDIAGYAACGGELSGAEHDPE